MTGSNASAARGGSIAVTVIAVATLAAAAVLFVQNAALRPLPWLNHDVAFLTWAGFEIDQGARLYVDFHEVNPPAATFLLATLFRSAALAGVSEIALIHLFVLLLGAAGLAALWVATAGRAGGLERLLVLPAYLLVIVRGNFANNVVPSAPRIPYDFAQREHLFALTLLPWVVWRIAGKPSRWPVLPLLVLLGYTSMFKPYWPPLVLAVEALGWWKARRADWPAWSALAAGMALPWVLLLLHSVDSFVAFVTEVVPASLSGYYGHYEVPLGGFLTSPLHLQMASLGLAFLACWGLCLSRRLVARPDLVLTLVLLAAGYLTVLQQRKFWSYHAMPYFAVVLVLGALLLAASGHALLDPRWRKRGAVAALVVAALLAGLAVRNLHFMLDRYAPKGGYLVPLVASAEPVMFFSMSVDYAYAPLLLRRGSVGPWSVHARLTGLLEIEDPERRRAAVDEYAREVRQTIERERPELLLFAPYTQALPPGTTLHGVLLGHGAIPPDAYEQVPPPEIAGRWPQAAGWVVYRRTGG